MLTGSCLCGDVRYEIGAAVEDLGSCHCRMCRKAHGAAFATFAQVPKRALRFTRGDDGIARYASSEAVERTFCRRCGSNLTFAHRAAPDSIWVAAGTLDDDPGVRPSHHLFVGSKAPWYEITDALPRHEAYPWDGEAAEPS